MVRRNGKVALRRSKAKTMAKGTCATEERHAKCHPRLLPKPMARDAVSGTPVAVANTFELAHLIALHHTDQVQPEQIFPKRDVTWHLDDRERQLAEDDLELLRFTIIARNARFLGWTRVCRSPFTDDDLFPDRARCIVSDQQAWLAWNNPHGLRRIEHAYVDNWQRERRRLQVHQAHVEPQANMPET
eukprot:6485201-Amphidinium_carterae.1